MISLKQRIEVQKAVEDLAAVNYEIGFIEGKLEKKLSKRDRLKAKINALLVEDYNHVK